jgi:curved DNA-binding protein CbpA
MDDLHDSFKILRIPSNADNRTLKKAYRRLVKRWHPDLNPGRPEAAMRFKQVQQAHKTNMISSFITVAGKLWSFSKSIPTEGVRPPAARGKSFPGRKDAFRSPCAPSVTAEKNPAWGALENQRSQSAHYRAGCTSPNPPR